jgi:hypothetical protein
LIPRCKKPSPRAEIVKRSAAPLGGRAHLSWFTSDKTAISPWSEDLAETLAAFVALASIQLALRRLTRA